MLQEAIKMPSTTFSIKSASNGFIFTREDYDATGGWSSTVRVFTDFSDVVKYLTENPITYTIS